MTMCEKIAKEMSNKNIKKSELANAVGVAYTTLDSMLKRNSDSVNLAVILKIASYLDISPDYLAYENIEDKHYGMKNKTFSYSNSSLHAKIEKLDEIDKTKAEAYVDGLLSSPKYEGAATSQLA